MKFKKLNTGKRDVSRDLGQFFQIEKLHFFTFEVLPVDISPHFLIFYQFNNGLLSTYQIPGLELNSGYSDKEASGSKKQLHSPFGQVLTQLWYRGSTQFL